MSRRTGKTVNSTDSAYQYTALDLVKETTGGAISEYVFGADIDEILNARISGTDYFYASDALGSAHQIVDAAGQLKNSYDYDVWGETHTLSMTIPNTFLFTGREAGENGLSQYRLRFYDPSVGRFISEDPIHFESGDINFYRYVYNSPANMVDPLGLWGLENLPDPMLDVLADAPEGAMDYLDTAGNYAAGMGDTLSWGATGLIRNLLGDSAIVNKCGGAYSAGEWSGLALDLAIGNAAGGSAGAGKEFSHAIPDNVLKKAPEAIRNIVRNVVGKSKLNGNYATVMEHMLNDPVRYRGMPRSLKLLNPINPAWLRTINRVPKLLVGAGAGVIGKAISDNNCDCE